MAPLLKAPRRHWDSAIALVLHLGLIGVCWTFGGFALTAFVVFVPFATAGVALRAHRDVLAGGHRERACGEPGDPCDEDGLPRAVSGRDPDHQARGGDQFIVGTEHRGTQPRTASSTMVLRGQMIANSPKHAASLSPRVRSRQRDR